MTSSAFLTVSELVKRFGEVVAINHVNLEIDPGEFFVLLGPSGCGKTTLLRCIAGLEQPDEGRIVIGDKTVFSSDDDIVLPPGRRNVDMVFQSYALWPHMSTFENIAFGLKLKKMSHAEIKRRVDQVLSDLGMDGLQKRFPFELSGGQQQRVALARLLANQPPVFLMDEPLSNLDARLRLDMRSELKRLHHDAGATTVYVTHDQTEALTMASRVVVMDKGVIQQIAPPEELYATPANLFVAEFIGAPRINLLRAKPFSDATGNRLQVEDFSIPATWLPDREEVIAGVRPENITLHTDEAPDTVQFSVYAVLPAGPEVFVHVVRGDITLVVRMGPGLKLDMDQQVWVDIDASAINYYEVEGGELVAPST
ncbi:ABC transporter ATP-binding protein [Candidatus Bipolaricaulota bacterium]|nr:ABC transporter ATP-binding protein [Candidatus Bipolaricaulota bacterium]